MIARLGTKDILAASLRELAKEKAVDKITIREITDNCGVSATTFYNHFQDKYELLAWIYNQWIEPIWGRIGNGVSWREALAKACTALLEDQAFYANALKNTAGQTSFRYATNDYAIGLLLSRCRDNAHTSELPKGIEFLVRFYMRGLSEAANDWFLQGQPITLEAFVDLLDQAMPEPLRPYLTAKTL